MSEITATGTSDGELMIGILKSLESISDAYGFKRLEVVRNDIGQAIGVPESSKMIVSYIIRNFRNEALEILKAFEYATVSGLDLGSYGKILTITMLGKVLGNFRDYKRKERVRNPPKLDNALPSGEVRKLNIEAKIITLNELLQPETSIKSVHYRLIDQHVERFSDKLKVSTYREVLASRRSSLEKRKPVTRKESKALKILLQESNIISTAKTMAQIRLANEWLNFNRENINIEEVINNIKNN